MARTLFPAFLDFVGRRVLVVGAGVVAAQKIPRLLEAGAKLGGQRPGMLAPPRQRFGAKAALRGRGG